MIPKTAIITGKYASQGEYVYASTNSPYEGYYYEFTGRKFAGEGYSVDALEIIKPSSTPQNAFLRNPVTSLYSLISNGLYQVPQSIDFVSIPYNNDSGFLYEQNQQTRFFCKKVNDPSTGIKEINENTYKLLQNNPLYQITYVGSYNNNFQTLDDAASQIKGLAAFFPN